MKNFAEIAASAKTAAVTAGATVASGLSQFLGLIPDEIGKLATLLGICLTIVMLSYWRAQTKKAQVELEILIIERDRKKQEA